MTAEHAAGVYPCCPHCDEALSDHVEHGGTVEKDRHDLPCSICEHNERIQPLIDSAVQVTRATAADTVLAAARRLCCGDNPAPHHAATHDHSQRMAFAEELARAVRGS